MHAALLFLIRPMQTLLTGRSNLIVELDVGLYFAVWLFTLLCVGIFFVAMRSVKFPEFSATNQIGRVSKGRFFAALGIWFIIWVLLVRSRFQEGDLSLLLESSSDYIHGKSIFVLNTVTMLLGFFIVKSYALESSSKFRIVLRWFLIILGVAAGVVSGSKTLALYPFFIVLLYRSVSGDGFSAAAVGTVLLVLLPVITLLNVVRHDGIGSIGQTITSGDFFLEIIPAVLERFYGTDIVYEIIRHHSFMNKEYFYGQSIVQMIYAFIPSALWPDKPVISFGKIVSDEYLPPIFHGLGISAAPTVFGELFANFSYASVIALPFFAYGFGRHLRAVMSKLHFAKLHYLEYYLVSFTTLAFVLEVSIVGWIVQLMAIYFGVYGLNKLITVSWSNLSKHYGKSV